MPEIRTTSEPDSQTLQILREKNKILEFTAFVFYFYFKFLLSLKQLVFV
jgi:hypothetical protein